MKKTFVALFIFCSISILQGHNIYQSFQNSNIVYLGNTFDVFATPYGLGGSGFNQETFIEFALLHELGHNVNVLLSGDTNNLQAQEFNNASLQAYCGF